MDKFRNRIKYYLVGFLLGAVAVAFFFGQRGCTWLPGNRVKSVIAENTIIVGDSIQALLNCLAEDSQPIFELLNSGGNVDFGGSKTREDNKIYKIDGANDLSVYFKLFESNNYDSYSEIIDVKSPSLNCNITVSNTNKKPLMLPRSLVIQIIESHSFTYYPIIDCQLDCYGIPEDSLKTLHKNATAIETPNTPGLINKVYNIQLTYEGVKYLIKYEIGENRTRIKNINHMDSRLSTICDCE